LNLFTVSKISVPKFLTGGAVAGISVTEMYYERLVLFLQLCVCVFFSQENRSCELLCRLLAASAQKITLHITNFAERTQHFIIHWHLCALTALAVFKSSRGNCLNLYHYTDVILNIEMIGIFNICANECEGLHTVMPNPFCAPLE